MIELVASYVIPASLELLPAQMHAVEARAFVLAIGLQESRLLHRDQVDEARSHGPALGLWQFERAGAVRGVLSHWSTRETAKRALRTLNYPTAGVERETLERVAWEALEHNDLLAAVFARLNLWWVPAALPGVEEPGRAWEQYLEAWRPGEPKPETWAGNWAEAWSRFT